MSVNQIIVSLSTLLCLVVLLTLSSSALSTSPSSLLLPYPIPTALPSTIYKINYVNRSSADQLLLISLEGNLAKSGLTATNQQQVQLLYKITGNGNGSDDNDSEWWYWDYYSKQPEFSSINFDSSSLFNAPLSKILSLFTSQINGYILTEFNGSEADPVNIAISWAAITPGSITASQEHISLLQSLNIPQLVDVRGLKEESFFLSFAPFNKSSAAEKWPWSNRFFSCQAPTKSLQFLSDWSIFASAAQFHHIPTVEAILQQLQAPEQQVVAWMGWTADTWGESDYTGAISRAGGIVWAADTLDNMASHAYFRSTAPIVNPTKADPNQLPDNNNKHTVSFLWTDGDSLCADMNGLANRQRYSSPNRAKGRMTFGIDPSLAHLAPGVLNWFYSTAGNNTGLVAFAPGYAYPDYMNDTQRYRWGAIAAESMLAADMKVTYVIGFNYSAIYGTDLLSQWNIDGVIYFDYPNYYQLIDGRAGMVKWIYEKPYIAIRDSLWGGHSTPQNISQLLNKQSTDHTSANGYSVIAVHAWSQTADTVLEVINALNDNIVVVKLDELVQLMTNNIKSEKNNQRIKHRVSSSEAMR